MPLSAEDRQRRREEQEAERNRRIAERQDNAGDIGGPAAGMRLPRKPDGSVDWDALKAGQFSNAILATLGPTLGDIYRPDGTIKTDLYDIPELQINLPDINNYVPGGAQYQNVYDQLAPSFWNTYKDSVENPMISRFAGSGALGSAVGGISAGAMDALTNKRAAAEGDISSRAYQAAQTPLMTAYGSEANRANTIGLEPWKASIQEAQYPYQIYPGMLSGALPPRQVETGGGSK